MRIIVLVISVLFTLSCKKNSIEPEVQSESLIIGYFSGNNDLKPDIENSLLKLQKGLVNAHSKTRVIVYIKTDPVDSYILEIKRNKSEVVSADTLSRFKNENSSDLVFFSHVLELIKGHSTSSHVSLILASHATAWFPSRNARVKAFGLDNNKEMNVDELRQALENLSFKIDNLIFDACNMASIEVVYELRNVCNYIIASPSLIVSYGFPYDLNLKYLTNNIDDLARFCREYVDYYKTLGFYRSSAMISLIDTRKVSDIAQFFKESNINANKIDTDKLQDLTFGIGEDKCYDLTEAVNFTLDNEQKTKFKKLIQASILYKNNTENYLGEKIVANSGFSIFVPSSKTTLNYLNYYQKLSWSKDSKYMQ